MAAIPVTSGLQLLLDARSITGLSDGDGVATWEDSHNSNDASQATAGNRPIYKTNIYGTNPAVRQDTANKIMSGSFADWTGGTGATFLAVCSNFSASPPASSRYFTTAATGGTDANNYLLGVGAAVEFWVNTANRLPTPLTALTSAGSTAPVIFGAAVDSSRLDSIFNGVWRGNISHSFSLPSSTQNVYATGFLNAGSPSTGYSGVVDYHFLIAYSRRLTASEISQVCQWIREELGIDTASSQAKPMSPFTQTVIA